MSMHVGKAKRFGLNSNSVRLSQSISRLNNAHGTCEEQMQGVFPSHDPEKFDDESGLMMKGYVLLN